MLRFTILRRTPAHGAIRTLGKKRMLRAFRNRVFTAGAFTALAAAASAAAQRVAQTPPMGWNSWDAFGFTINEADFKANAAVLAGLKQYGWKYAVLDEGWYMENPLGDELETRQYRLNAHGLLVPVVSRFPSAAGGRGFKPLADWVHEQGLKFGIHIVRGIPKHAVRDNLAIANSAFRAVDAADAADTCPWDDGNYGVRNTKAGQAYYDSMLRLYAGWGLDFLKVDCIADNPYKESEIRQIAAAIQRTGRPIVLSLSPGPTNVAHAVELRRFAQMWRVINDMWDGWAFKHDRGTATSPTEFPTRSINWHSGIRMPSPVIGPTPTCSRSARLRRIPAGATRASRDLHRTRRALSSRSGR